MVEEREMNKLLTLLLYIFYPPCTPKGREQRINHLMEETGEVREVCAAVIYSRDAKRVPFTFTDDEKKETTKLLYMLEHNRIRMPADRNHEEPVAQRPK